MNRLQGKCTLITGGTTGIGIETAKQFLAEGARVAVTGRNPDTLAQAKLEMGKEVIFIKSDAGQVGEQKHLAEEIAKVFDKLDAVFLNAGIGIFQPLEAWDEATFDNQIAVNLKGPYFLIQNLLPILANPASIVLNTSINAHIGMPNSSVYGASKAAMISLARTLSGELIERGIRVNAISPGPIATPILGKSGLPAEQVQQLAEALRNQIPLKRFGDPIEIAKAAVFLASDESSFMLGSEMIIDGGVSTLSWQLR
ncbi:SDR family oxidoreductase [Nostoc sp. 'Peltigera malacea cyanobiont' DB3992]|uniref:SDR family oxidoreductase n=1 Tax=Nostoc sp. 'Peltigera malacea cyanobiont' DB3992 TaxID=1206980 RepID=UPI000C049412|nr:SDR family oxidoreductase [Nostoc sp. 'Peltigera malacea cyanobiont' DB3992]PHM05843.1 short-chain dehydrogenase [Nostoc sp. 'Peltigera malacea cyanobiont' DB3992]